MNSLNDTICEVRTLNVTSEKLQTFRLDISFSVSPSQQDNLVGCRGTRRKSQLNTFLHLVNQIQVNVSQNFLCVFLHMAKNKASRDSAQTRFIRAMGFFTFKRHSREEKKTRGKKKIWEKTPRILMLICSGRFLEIEKLFHSKRRVFGQEMIFSMTSSALLTKNILWRHRKLCGAWGAFQRSNGSTNSLALDMIIQRAGKSPRTTHKITNYHHFRTAHKYAKTVSH